MSSKQSLYQSCCHSSSLLVCLSRQVDGFCRCVCVIAGLVRHRRLGRQFYRRVGDSSGCSTSTQVCGSSTLREYQRFQSNMVRGFRSCQRTKLAAAAGQYRCRRNDGGERKEFSLRDKFHVCYVPPGLLCTLLPRKSAACYCPLLGVKTHGIHLQHLARPVVRYSFALSTQTIGLAPTGCTAFIHELRDASRCDLRRAFWSLEMAVASPAGWSFSVSNFGGLFVLMGLRDAVGAAAGAMYRR